MTIYFVEGNIGCGKTTLLEAIQQYLKENNISNVEVVYEPVVQWQKLGILDKFYKDINRWSYTFQNIAFITKIMELNKMVRSDVVYIVERSPMTDRNCFAELCYESGFMTDMEWEAYNLWYNHFTNQLAFTGYIYVVSSPDVCIERINHRSRGEESGIKLDYLTSLHNKHEKWLRSVDSKILYLDDNYSLDRIEDIVKKVLDFV